MAIKQVIVCIGILSVVIMAAMTIMIIDSRMIRKDELENAVTVSCKNTFDKMVAADEDSDKKSEYNNSGEESEYNNSGKVKEIQNDFIDELFLNITSESDDICVMFYGVDFENGLLSVGVTESYKNLLGITTKLTVYRTMILE